MTNRHTWWKNDLSGPLFTPLDDLPEGVVHRHFRPLPANMVKYFLRMILLDFRHRTWADKSQIRAVFGRLWRRGAVDKGLETLHLRLGLRFALALWCRLCSAHNRGALARGTKLLVGLTRFQEKWTRFSVRKRDQTRNLEHFHESINLGNALESSIAREDGVQLWRATRRRVSEGWALVVDNLYGFVDAYRWWVSLAAFALLVIGLSTAGAVLIAYGSVTHQATISMATPPASLIAAMTELARATDQPVAPLAPGPSGLDQVLEQVAKIPSTTEATRKVPPIAALDVTRETAEQRPPVFETKAVELHAGDTLMNVLIEAGVPRLDAYNAIQAMRPKLDPRRIRPGQRITITRQIAPKEGAMVVFNDNTVDVENTVFEPRLDQLAIQTKPDRRLQITRNSDDTYTIEEIVAQLEEKFLRVSGKIDSSLFVAADDLGIPANIIIELIRMYSYDVDFQREIRKGDEFEIFYTRYIDGKGNPIKDGVIHYGSLTLSDHKLAYYRYMTPDDQITDYYDKNGQSAQKFLMRTPIDGARISSSFGRRKHPILGYGKMHKGVDFAAPRGTPVMAAGNGIVERASRYSTFGNYIRIRHANGYKTAYAHLNGYAKGVKRGARVKQAQIIGYVGSTGQSTGPHLHYEVHLNGKQVNPATIRVPTGRKLEGDILQAFLNQRSELDTKMAAMPAVTRLSTAQLD
ncbi:MAG: M23 family metallopeptidase [Alphaproteobacteria bacterium]|nr:MAG: M23 family metallopeptidase [Alphaproteobacteria bacterium]